MDHFVYPIFFTEIKYLENFIALSTTSGGAPCFLTTVSKLHV
jgi:hypothetical protein